MFQKICSKDSVMEIMNRYLEVIFLKDKMAFLKLWRCKKKIFNYIFKQIFLARKCLGKNNYKNYF